DRRELMALFQQYADDLASLLLSQLRDRQQHLRWFASRLKHPDQKLQEQTQHLDHLEIRLKQSLIGFMKQQQHKLKSMSQLLHSISPLQTLARGYAIVADTNGHVVQDAAQVNPGDRISTKLKQGSLDCIVTDIKI